MGGLTVIYNTLKHYNVAVAWGNPLFAAAACSVSFKASHRQLHIAHACAL